MFRQMHFSSSVFAAIEERKNIWHKSANSTLGNVVCDSKLTADYSCCWMWLQGAVAQTLGRSSSTRMFGLLLHDRSRRISLRLYMIYYPNRIDKQPNGSPTVIY